MAKSSKKAAATPMPAAALDLLETVEIPAGVFKNTCLTLMDEVNERRRQYVITKHGRPVAKLVPPDAASAPSFGFLRGTITEHGDIIAPDFDAWGEQS